MRCCCGKVLIAILTLLVGNGHSLATCIGLCPPPWIVSLPNNRYLTLYIDDESATAPYVQPDKNADIALTLQTAKGNRRFRVVVFNVRITNKPFHSERGVIVTVALTSEKAKALFEQTAEFEAPAVVHLLPASPIFLPQPSIFNTSLFCALKAFHWREVNAGISEIYPSSDLEFSFLDPSCSSLIAECKCLILDPISTAH